jgi:hypothetical protein
MAFGFDSSIMLGATRTQEPTPNETLRTLADLAQARAQQQHSQASLADLVRSSQQEEALRRVYQQNAGSPEAIPGALLRGGHGDAALRWLTEQATAEARKRQGMPQQLSPAEEQARLARAALEQAKADALKNGKGGKEMDPDVRDNLRARTDSIRKKTKGSGASAGPNPLLKLDGYDLGDGFSLKPEVAEKLREAQGQTNQMTRNVDELMGLYKQYGNKVLPGPARARMEAVARNLQLMAKGKTMYELGVIAGPDMDLLNSVVPVPGSKTATIADWFSGDSGGDASETMERLRVMREQLGQKFELAAKSRGYQRRKAEQKAKGGFSDADRAEMEALAKELGETP